ncbi:GNAT family N-acetyltransferase [Catenuloplanes indicus]|uniref:GNAT superfamily N-acetyltransferase n=1 Tax=Catenuloplanes indicus TaxID=137267 RepID=A0AAE3W1V4_9ACTN|nr:GNAT family N-acetyltransferase [Catenuloplanes indicus]MDQ0368001.1 GNAT superfamily N-acetyltransferase [Catenuloplanes indicus]
MNGSSTPRPRRATLDDVRSVVYLLELMHDENATARDTGPEDAALLAEILAQTGRELLVIEDPDGRVAGTVDVVITRNLSRNRSPWAIVENLVVRPEERGRGYGRALMEEAARIATAAGCYKIQLVSNNARREAHGLYRSLGFNADVSGFRRYLSPVRHY